MRKEIKDSDFQKEVLEKNHLVVVQFHAPWCAPCKLVTPQLEALALTHEDDIDVVALDINDEQKIAAEYGIRNIPTVLFIRGGEVKEKVIGARTDYDEFIEKLKY